MSRQFAVRKLESLLAPQGVTCVEINRWVSRDSMGWAWGVCFAEVSLGLVGYVELYCYMTT